jgi:hypothetical protein
MRPTTRILTIMITVTTIIMIMGPIVTTRA